jgi:hypothetical protein
MTNNLGAQAASMVDDKIREFRTLQEELNEHRSNLGMLMAQRNENEMVKQVRSMWSLCPISCIYYIIHGLSASQLPPSCRATFDCICLLTLCFVYRCTGARHLRPRSIFRIGFGCIQASRPSLD